MCELLLRAAPFRINIQVAGLRPSGPLWSEPSQKTSVTVIRLEVRVPVLSVRISFAPPIVSAASNRLTRLFSYLIFSTEYAKLNVTARGSPSGTATTTTVIAITIASTRRLATATDNNGVPYTNEETTVLAHKANNVPIATYVPILPIKSATRSSFC